MALLLKQRQVFKEEKHALEQQLQQNLINKLDEERFNLEMANLDCLIRANQARYDLMEFYKENFGIPVIILFPRL